MKIRDKSASMFRAAQLWMETAVIFLK